jgi:predicted alpha/beta hydrolase
MHRSLVIASDGHQIAARFFRPEGKAKGSVLIVPAMGTSQDYYRPFASWLAAQGYVAATFDYRGTGLSRPRELRGFKADIFDWARLDCYRRAAHDETHRAAGHRRRAHRALRFLQVRLRGFALARASSARTFLSSAL